MKKNHLCFLASIVLALLLSSCMTISTEVNSPVNNEDGNITIEIKKVIQRKGIGWWALLIPITTTNSQGIEVLITNNTDTPQSINWNKSSLNWHNKSSPIFLSGMKYKEAGTALIPNTAIGANKTVRTAIYPASNVEWTGKKWTIDGMNLKAGDELSLIAFTESGIQIETTYTVTKSDGIHFLW